MDRATLLRVFHHVYQTTPRTEENAALLNEVAEVLTREWTP